MFQKKAPPTENENSQERRFTDTAVFETIIGVGVRLKGDVSGKTAFELKGTIEGTGKIDGLCHIREGGKFIGQVTATQVVIEGEVEGNIIANDKVELRSTGRVKGDIRANTVAIAEGSYFEGAVHMGSAGSKKPITFQEKRLGDPSVTVSK